MDHYGEMAAADAYHLLRGNAEWAAASASPDTARIAALVTASDYIDSFRARFPGYKTGGRVQLRAWPRTDAVDTAGEEIPVDEIPLEIEQATYEAALLRIKGVDLRPNQERAIKREKVKGGPVETETEYVDGASVNTNFQVINDLLSNLFYRGGGGVSVDLLRV